MKSLLDQFKPRTAGFRPSTPKDLFALRLAQKLGDAPAAQHYVELADSYSEGHLLNAYRRSVRTKENHDRGRLFHQELERTPGNGSHDQQDSLLSIRVERRTIAAAVFRGQHLEYADSRQLSSTQDKAVGSASGFVNWMLARFPVESAAFETILNGHEIQRRVLHDAISTELRERIIPIWEMPRTALLEGFAHPALKSREQLREIATTIWPIIAGTHAKVFIQDAAILGLYVQTERLFIINGNLS